MKSAKIIRRMPAQPEFKKPPKMAGLTFLDKYYKKLQEAHGPQKTDIVLSRRVDEGIAKDYRNDGIVAGNKNGRFSTIWVNPLTGQEYNSNWKARKETPSNVKIVRIPEARNQVSVLSRAIDSYDYYPDVKRLIVRYTSNPTKGYTFGNVTQRRKNDLDNAASKGRFVNNILRKYNRIDNY